MNLFIDGMACCLCGNPVSSEQNRFGTWGVWLPSNDRLHRYCDAGMHWDCYAAWKYRERFARSYFDFWIEEEKGNPCWWRVYCDESVFVTVNPQSPISSSWVFLAATGSRFSVPLDEWADWLIKGDDEAKHAVESQALVEAKQVLYETVPTAGHLLAQIDPDSKSELVKRQRLESEQRELVTSQKRERMEARNRLCAQYCERIAREGLSCPHCGTFSHDYRLSAKEGYPSLVICRKCGDVAEPPVS